MARLRVTDENVFRVRVSSTYFIDIPEGDEEKARKDPYEYYFEAVEVRGEEIDSVALAASTELFNNVKGYIEDEFIDCYDSEVKVVD
jgi:hypothetical protein